MLRLMIALEPWVPLIAAIGAVSAFGIGLFNVRDSLGFAVVCFATAGGTAGWSWKLFRSRRDRTAMRHTG